MLNVALPKGRLGEKVYKMLERAGYSCEELLKDTRKLVFTDEKSGVSYFWVKPSDVTVYVEHGVADIGVAGKDILKDGRLPYVRGLGQRVQGRLFPSLTRGDKVPARG